MRIPVLSFASVAVICATAVALVVLCGLTDQDDVPLRPLEGSKLILRDANGKIYATIDKNEQAGAMISLLDANGNSRVRLQVQNDGVPSVRLSDGNGTDALELSILDELTPRVLLRDAAGTERAKMFLMPDGSPLMFLKDKAGEKQVELVSMGNGTAGLIIFDDQKKPSSLLARLPGHDIEGLVLLNKDGEPQVRVGLDSKDSRVISGFIGNE